MATGEPKQDSSVVKQDSAKMNSSIPDYHLKDYEYDKFYHNHV
jgi:hypothetical protein